VAVTSTPILSNSRPPEADMNPALFLITIGTSELTRQNWAANIILVLNNMGQNEKSPNLFD